ncbi:MAG: PIN domain-containing protein [Gallionella sp.]|nr:PIN domain-containing protein [Gallionella sp.]
MWQLKKLGLSLSETGKLLAMLEATCRVEIVTPATMHRALDIAGLYGLSWYDSLIVAAALDAGCDTLYTEDLQHGQVIDGKLTVFNPFPD